MLMTRVAGLTLGLALFGCSRPGEEVRLRKVEASTEDLDIREGHLFLKGTTNLLSGWLVERYPDGRLKSRSEAIGGALNGVSEGWHTNGVLDVREAFLDGVSHGTRQRWNTAGQRVSEAQIVHGKLEGTFRRWHENGQLAEEIAMKAGAPEGLSRSWYLSGSLKMIASVSNGQVTTQQSFEDGAPLPGEASVVRANLERATHTRLGAAPSVP